MESYHFYCRHFKEINGKSSNVQVDIYILNGSNSPILSRSCWKCDMFHKCLYLKFPCSSIEDTPDVFCRLSGFIENGAIIRKHFLGLSNEDPVN